MFNDSFKFGNDLIRTPNNKIITLLEKDGSTYLGVFHIDKELLEFL